MLETEETWSSSRRCNLPEWKRLSPEKSAVTTEPHACLHPPLQDSPARTRRAAHRRRRGMVMIRTPPPAGLAPCPIHMLLRS
jgi:hypothetical protein